MSYEAQFSYNPDRYGFQVSHLLVGENFNPEVGFLRRDDFRRTFASAYFSPRPASIQAVRQFTWRANFNYIENGAGIVETREARASFNTEFETSDAFSVDVASAYELLELPFEIHADVTIPPGRYEFADVTLGYTLGGQRRANGRLTVQFGQFFDGDLKALGFSSGRIEVLPQFLWSPAHLSTGSSSRRAPSPPRFSEPGPITASHPHVRQRAVPVQLSAEALSTNLRLRWEYSPGSELFVVYTDERTTVGHALPRSRTASSWSSSTVCFASEGATEVRVVTVLRAMPPLGIATPSSCRSVLAACSSRFTDS